MDIRKIKKLIELLEESGIAEIEIKEGEEALRISRMPTGTALAHHQIPQMAALPLAAPLATPPKAAVPTAAEAAIAKAKANEHVITAPMVGTFYRSPSPTAEPFVSEGDTVAVDQVLCVLEAMKLFNELKSEHAGVIRAVLVGNAEPVEYGQPLFELELA